MSLQTAHAITLVAGPEGRLSETVLADCGSLLSKQGGTAIRHIWHKTDEAADLFCLNLSAEAIYTILRPILTSLTIDIIVQPTIHRRKKLLLADMESTIIEQEMLDELAAMIGIGEKVADITRRAMNGELDFNAALKERVAMLAGQHENLLSKAASKITMMGGAKELINAMKGQGAQCWLVSGGFTCFAEKIGKLLGFDRVFANELIIADHKIVGTVTEPILDKNGKKDLLDQARRELSIQPTECLAIGDGANDIPIITACNAGAGLGIAYHAKPAVRAVTPHQINYADLTTLVYAQG